MKRHGGAVYIHGIACSPIERQSEVAPVGHVRVANGGSKTATGQIRQVQSLEQALEELLDAVRKLA